jgi:hypothetical protein
LNPGPKHASLTLRSGLLGLLSGTLSCLLVESRILYVAREQKTYDQVVWPGLAFGLIVLFPISRWAGDAWARSAGVLIASSVVYPIAWRVAVPSTAGPSSWALMIAEFVLAGFLGSFVLSSALLFRRPCWVRSAVATVLLGAAVGGLMGANLRAAITVAHWPVSARDALGLSVVLWQAVVGASLGSGVQARPKNEVAAGTSTTNSSGDAAASR